MSTGGIYTYDGNGLRVKKVAVGKTTVIIYANGQDIAEYDNGAAPSSPSREFVYSVDGLLATLSGGKTTYHHKDHLSVRLLTDGTPGSPTYGQVIAQQGGYPYGESWYTTGTGAPDNFIFTTYERDSESGVDYALARYYDSTMGRFCSADPLDGQPNDPQSWNHYAYVRNDPVNLTDPSGQGLLSFLIDFFVEMFLPEIAPAIFGQFGLAAADATDWTVGAGTTSLGTQGIVGTLTVTAGTVTAGSTTGAILGAGLTAGAVAEGAGANPFSDTPQFRGAKDLAQKPKCANWLTSLAQKAAANVKGSALTPQESQYFADQIKGIPTTLDTTPTNYQQITNPTNSEGFTTNAEVDLKANPPSMTLYKGFFKQEFLGSQSQIVLHEGVHIATRFGDRALARAATGKNYPDTVKGNSQASQDWHHRLQENCD